MDAFMGMVMPVAFNYAPKGWAFCNGQTMSVAQNSALFSLLGTVYGGDGQQTFGIPDLRGRVVAGSQGNGPGLTPIVQGQLAGTNTVTVIGTGNVVVALTTANLPAHNHAATLSLAGLTASTTLNASTLGTGGSLAPTATNNNFYGTSTGSPTAAAIYGPTPAAGTTVAMGGISTTVSGSGSVTTDNTGSGAPLAAPVQTQANVSIMQPYLGLNYVICIYGIYPSRN